MKTNVTVSDFRDAFRDMGREDQFSYEALGLIYDYLEETGCPEEGGPMLDVIAVCCEFSEDSPKDVADSYSIDISDCEDDDEIKDAVAEYLQDHTSLVGITSEGSFVYQQF
jgi:hypothetical protein